MHIVYNVMLKNGIGWETTHRVPNLNVAIHYACVDSEGMNTTFVSGEYDGDSGSRYSVAQYYDGKLAFQWSE